MSFDDLIEMVDAADPMLYDVPREQIVQMWRDADEMARYGREAKAKLTKHIAERFDEPIDIGNGTVLVPKTETKRTGFRKTELHQLVVARFARDLAVPGEGGLVRAFDEEVVRRFYDVATGRTRTWRDAGVNLDEFAANVEHGVPTVEVVTGRRPR